MHCVSLEIAKKSGKASGYFFSFQDGSRKICFNESCYSNGSFISFQSSFRISLLHDLHVKVLYLPLVFQLFFPVLESGVEEFLFTCDQIV